VRRPSRIPRSISSLAPPAPVDPWQLQLSALNGFGSAPAGAGAPTQAQPAIAAPSSIFKIMFCIDAAAARNGFTVGRCAHMQRTPGHTEINI
jgi:hypothetical protein